MLLYSRRQRCLPRWLRKRQHWLTERVQPRRLRQQRLLRLLSSAFRAIRSTKLSSTSKSMLRVRTKGLHLNQVLHQSGRWAGSQRPLLPLLPLQWLQLLSPVNQTVCLARRRRTAKSCGSYSA